jgi:hypothetical protein
MVTSLTGPQPKYENRLGSRADANERRRSDGAVVTAPSGGQAVVTAPSSFSEVPSPLGSRLRCSAEAMISLLDRRWTVFTVAAPYSWPAALVGPRRTR